MDVLQRNPASDSDETATKPDFTAATHGIMGALHQVMQVQRSSLEQEMSLAMNYNALQSFVIVIKWSIVLFQGHHKVEGAWQHRKLRLHQRLQLCVFQQDVRQVESHMYLKFLQR